MTRTTIAGEVAELHASRAQDDQSEVMEVFAREQRELATRRVPDGIAADGSVLQDAELLDVHGEPTTLYEVLDEKPAVVVFYRGAWCPYCNIALRTYQSELLPELAARGVSLLAISPQRPDGSLSMQEKNDLAFAVLSDPGNQIAGQLGILTAPSSGVRAVQLELGLDLEAVNADGTVAIPMPTTVIADAERVIRWIDVHPDYTTRSEPSEILDALDVRPPSADAG